jgi:hypothetical protein
MSPVKAAQNTAPSQRLTSLQVWVATSGCWTASGLALPHSAITVIGSTVVGVGLGYASSRLGRRPGREKLTLLPTLIGLLAATAATHMEQFPDLSVENTLGDVTGIKSWITAALVVLFIAENLWPIIIAHLGRWLKYLAKCTLRQFTDLVREIAKEDRSRQRRLPETGRRQAGATR